MTQEREIEIVGQILSGNVSLYEEIVRAYQGTVVNLCYRLAGNRVDIEEATQQVFVELYTALPRFRYESKLSTFIYRITVNVVSKMLKYDKRMLSLEQDWLPERDPKGSREEQMIRGEEEHKLREAIGRLKAEQRTALVLFAFKEFSYNEVAEVMGVSLSKVESLIFRAKKNLRKMLEDK